MIIWFAVIIPIIAAPILYFGFKHKILWWEMLIPVGVSVLFIALMKMGVEKAQTADTEYWTNYATQARYQEPWTEEWDEYISEQGHTETDSKGNSRYVVDVPAHLEHRIVHHSPYWEMYDNGGGTHSISKEYYNHLVRLWGNKDHKKVTHYRQTSIGDGGYSWTNWNNIRDTMIVLTTSHSYENRIIAARSVFKFPEVEDTSELFDYPDVHKMDTPSILGSDDGMANRWLCVRNAELGVSKQVRMWILVYNDLSLQTAIDQESYWQGGNKNEFVVCIGTNDKKEVTWCYVFSWSESERLKIDVRQFVQSQSKLDLSEVARYTADEAEKQFVRKQFVDFNYLSVEPPTWAVVTTYIITFLITAGIGVWSVMNEFDEPYRQFYLGDIE